MRLRGRRPAGAVGIEEFSSTLAVYVKSIAAGRAQTKKGEATLARLKAKGQGSGAAAARASAEVAQGNARQESAIKRAQQLCRRGGVPTQVRDRATDIVLAVSEGRMTSAAAQKALKGLKSLKRAGR